MESLMCGLQRERSIPPQGLSMCHCQGLEGLLLCPSLPLNSQQVAK